MAEPPARSAGGSGFVEGAGAPPHDEEAEASVLGAVMLAERWFDTISVDVRLHALDFYRPRHRLIFEAMSALNADSEPIDTLTVANRLTETNNLEEAGGKDYIETLVTRVPAIANTKQYARIVKENALLRGLIQASHDIQAAVAERDGDPQQLVFEVAQDTHSGELVQLASILHEQIDALEQQALHGSTVTGTPTGFTDIDELTGGLQGGNLIIIAARPAMGKSALVANIAENAALKGYPVAIFSMEMSKTELSQRFISSQAKISGDAMRKGQIKKTDWPKVLSAAQAFDQAPIWIDDSSDINITELRAKARRLHGRYLGSPNEETGKTGLGLIIVDYLQLLRATDGRDSRVEQVAQMSRGLKILARELDVPVIAVSQLSRAVENRQPPRPQLADLRECVTGDTLVWLADGSRVPIEELVGTTPDVLSTAPNGEVVVKRSDCVWEVGKRSVFEVTYASGRKIKATEEHRLLTGSGWKTVSGLRAGDRVALAAEVPEPTDQTRWSDLKVSMLGQMIGDGSYLSGQPMRFTSATDENSELVAEAARSEFGCTVKRYDHSPSWHQLLISGNGNRWKPAGVNAWLRELGIFDQRSHQKRIPRAAFKLPTRQVALLLKHLWATDGSIWVGERNDGRRLARVAYSTSSAGLAHDVNALLLRLGIVGRIYESPASEMRHVVVSGRTAQEAFAEQVGAFGPRRGQLEGLLKHFAQTESANTNVDTLPIERWESVRRSMKQQGVSQRAMAAARGTSYGGSSHFSFAPTREVLASYASALDDPKIALDAAEQYFWDAVKSIEPVGESEVYDLTVPGTANWVTGDGIITHNSGQIEQDADVVCFIYREEYYDPDSERIGLADVIFAKHRNGPVGDVELTFMKHYPKFGNAPKQRDREAYGSGDSYQAARVSDSQYAEEETF